MTWILCTLPGSPTVDAAGTASQGRHPSRTSVRIESRLGNASRVIPAVLKLEPDCFGQTRMRLDSRRIRSAHHHAASRCHQPWRGYAEMWYLECDRHINAIVSNALLFVYSRCFSCVAPFPGSQQSGHHTSSHQRRGRHESLLILSLQKEKKKKSSDWILERCKWRSHPTLVS